MIQNVKIAIFRLLELSWKVRGVSSSLPLTRVSFSRLLSRALSVSVQLASQEHSSKSFTLLSTKTRILEEKCVIDHFPWSTQLP